MERVSSTSPNAGALRREPIQRRSAERLARILDACAALLDEVGYEALTTRAVADRAGVPIGSVYRFFGNKRAMADALAVRNLDQYAERVEERVGELPPGDWRPAIDVALDEYLAMKRVVPGFALVDFGVPAGGDVNQRVADRIGALLAGRLGRPLDESIRRSLLVCVEAADALLQLAFRADPSGDPALVTETRLLLHAYLAQSLD
ncbi:TetR/AcrR family transcriptional regulator [Streptomyces triticagri]|uniref:TetR/AcrR family transcriptional regulator n=1 Tax=Streptomyces triticagri TaxID=2293568 RepID=A0A372MAJ8_9ACTN|nr:TetR/AcrR family transcriptional regulator [Streptomyces triticagri]RFU87317.1 TetR/AcrR family transcriptional regulator [Streptomyces triticagri]